MLIFPDFSQLQSWKENAVELRLSAKTLYLIYQMFSILWKEHREGRKKLNSRHLMRFTARKIKIINVYHYEIYHKKIKNNNTL